MRHQHLNQTKNAIAQPLQRRIASPARGIAPPQTQNAPSSLHPIEELQGLIGNLAVNQLLANQPRLQAKPMFNGLSHELIIQPKLTIGAVGDKYEQEADWVAANVVDRIHAPQSSVIQREEMPEDDEELRLSPTIQRVAENRDAIAASPDLEASINQAKGSGESIPQKIRQPMENAFGADFSRVKVHRDERSHQLNLAIQAKAFTTGKDIFFRQGAYNPGSRVGQELITHELTHVVQQQSELKPLLQRDITIGDEETKKIITRERLKEMVVNEIKNQNNNFTFSSEKVKNIVDGIESNKEKFNTSKELDNYISNLLIEETKKTIGTSQSVSHQIHSSKRDIFEKKDQAKKIYPFVQNVMIVWANSTGGVAVFAPIKSTRRIQEKTQIKAEEEKVTDWGKTTKGVKDILRGSILYETMESLYNGAIIIKSQIENNPKLKVIKANQLFTHPKKDGGYRDIKIVFDYKIDEDKVMSVELQLNLAQNVVVKEGKQFSSPLSQSNYKIPKWFDTKADYQDDKRENFNVRQYIKDIKYRKLSREINDLVRQKLREMEKYLAELRILNRQENPESEELWIPLSHTIYERQQENLTAPIDSVANQIYKLLFDIEQIIATPESGVLPFLKDAGFKDANPPRD